LLVVYTAVFTPFTVAFLLNEDEKRANLNKHASTRLLQKQQIGADPFVIIDLIVDIMFLCDIFISFRTTFVNNEGEAVYDPMVIAKNYLKGWFAIDAIAAMPYDLILFGSGNIDVFNIIFIIFSSNVINLLFFSILFRQSKLQAYLKL
jgi:potassium voltage-gated channel Eag-related subfamily H protein 2